LDGKTPRHRSVEEMAAHYVGEIRSFQPEGPYYLGGYSLGGVIAYEAGRQLSRLGQKIGTLALLDSGVTGPLPRTLYLRTMPAILLNSLRSNIRRWRTKTKCERRSFFRTRWAALANLLSTHRAPSRAGASPTGAGGLYPQVPWFEDYFYVVASSYRIGSYPGAVDVFVSDEADPAVFLWRHFALGGVSRRRVSGSHLDLILSPARTADLAGALTAVLRLARGKQTARDVP